MTAWVANQFSEDDLKRFDARTDLRRLEKFQGIGFWGPSPNDLNTAVPDLLKGVKLTAEPWKDLNAGAIGQNATMWVPDPDNKDFGVWGLAASGGDYVKAAQQNGNPGVFGYYAKLADHLPPIAKVAALGFQDGALETLYHFFPDQRPVKIRTLEMVATLNDVTVPLTDVVSYIGGDDYALADGAQLNVTDSAQDGFNLAGNPGAWSKYYGKQSPATFGLDKDKGVLYWNGTKGVVLDAKTLTQWFGPQWRGTIYATDNS